MLEKSQKKVVKQKYNTVVDFTERVKFIQEGFAPDRSPLYRLSVEGVKLTDQEMHSLQSEAFSFDKTRLKKIIINSVRQEAIDMALHNNGKVYTTDAEYKADEDLGRALVKGLDIIENILYTIKVQTIK